MWDHLIAPSDGSEARDVGGRVLYKLRQQTSEPVFGIIKAVLSFTGFALRGLDKVARDRELVVLAYHCLRICRLKLEMAS